MRLASFTLWKQWARWCATARVGCPWCLCVSLHVSLHVSLMVLWWLWARWLQLEPLPASVCVLDVVFHVSSRPVSLHNASSWVSWCISLCVKSCLCFLFLQLHSCYQRKNRLQSCLCCRSLSLSLCLSGVVMPFASFSNFPFADLVPPRVVGWMSFLRNMTSTSWRKCRNASNTNCERLTVFRLRSRVGITLGPKRWTSKTCLKISIFWVARLSMDQWCVDILSCKSSPMLLALNTGNASGTGFSIFQWLILLCSLHRLQILDPLFSFFLKIISLDHGQRLPIFVLIGFDHIHGLQHCPRVHEFLLKRAKKSTFLESRIAIWSDMSHRVHQFSSLQDAEDESCMYFFKAGTHTFQRFVS